MEYHGALQEYARCLGFAPLKDNMIVVKPTIGIRPRHSSGYYDPIGGATNLISKVLADGVVEPLSRWDIVFG